RDVHLSIRRQEVMHLDLECTLYLTRGSAETDHSLALAHLVHSEALRHKPSLYLRDIVVVHAKMTAEFLRRRPLMVVGVVLVLLPVDDKAEFPLLLLIRLQHHDHVLCGRTGIEATQVGCPPHRARHVSVK